ncbi:AraC family transcriptional regulator [Neorhizobium sp. Rsf11]|uniref:AraC family transcriptional regulator n=3 Tax=Rhizobium/Agrobacterium group TaxID=227290 RepID=A0ABY5XLU5_RHISU|nr:MULTISPECIES: AraC family transcriptional regulator [Rhizobium/Agrobacterium group]MCC2612155.1 AraC family transcriptional regulator [Neorhizobium petrolearium]UWU15555.1 AraC family transcriptional regulator [Rhizobium sullae]WGI67306.1 AraC family transcriptional regulator [Neorhizobium petrolearium]
MDPFLDLIRLLHPRAALLGRGIDATGDWGITFPALGDLLFLWLEDGTCQLIRPGCDPLPLNKGDFVLLRTTLSFTLTSNRDVEPLDSVAAVAAKQPGRLRLGFGQERPISLHMGKFLFSTANEDLLTGLLPPLVQVPSHSPKLHRLHNLLTLMESEGRDPGPAGEFIIARLVELALVEILRMPASRLPGQTTDPAKRGLLAGLRDPVAGKAIRAMHADVGQEWTVDSLARLCGVSRSTFATRFHAVVGVSPISYLLRWRIALAKEALGSGTARIEEVAFSIGYKSGSAFSTAFSRAVGCSPRQFAENSARYA